MPRLALPGALWAEGFPRASGLALGARCHGDAGSLRAGVWQGAGARRPWLGQLMTQHGAVLSAQQG